MFAEAYLLAGRVQEAEQFLRPALDRMRATRRYTGEADCLWLLGEVEARRDRPDLAQAETRFRAGLALAEEHELRPRQAQCHLALGTLYRRLGRPDEARAELSAAVSMLGEMGMTRWLQEAEAEVTKADGSIAGNTVADHR